MDECSGSRQVNVCVRTEDARRRRSPRVRAFRAWRPWSVVAALVCLLLAACSTGPGSDDGASDRGATDTAPPADSGTVLVISDFTFDVPDAVPAGATITIRNEDSVGHTVTSDEEGVFDVAVGPGEEVSFAVPDESGEYPFHCMPHPMMTATLVVEPADG